MRLAVVNKIYEAALNDKKIYFITGDLGHAHSDDFKNSLPGQYINAGMAEQNMIGVAAGLALSGMKVFVYSIVPFITMRCFEQIRNDVCYQNVNVTIIGIGAGYAYSLAGATHHGLEDLAIMRALPEMHIYSPADPNEAELLISHIIHNPSPSYLRIGKGGEPNFVKNCPNEIGKLSVLKQGNDITLFSTGSVVSEAISAANELEKLGISTEVVNVNVIKPIDGPGVIARIENRRAIFTLEEHGITGGLGSCVAEIISETKKDYPLIFRRFGVPDYYSHELGNQAYLRQKIGINFLSLVKQISTLLLSTDS